MKIAFFKAINFIETGIKSKLLDNKNVQTNQTTFSNNSNSKNDTYNSYLGYFGSLGGLIVGSNKPEESDNKSKISGKSNNRRDEIPILNTTQIVDKDNVSVKTISTFKAFNPYDTELSRDNHEKIIFKYTPYDIVKMIKEFTKKVNEKEMAKFFNDITTWFSELTYNSYLTITEINELNDLKIALNIRYKAYLKHCKKLDEELVLLKDKNASFEEERKLLNSLKTKNQELEKKVTLIIEENSKIKSNLNELMKQHNIYKNKWINTENEYIHYKELIVEEYRSLLFDLNEAEKDRDYYKSKILTFKNMLSKENII